MTGFGKVDISNKGSNGDWPKGMWIKCALITDIKNVTEKSQYENDICININADLPEDSKSKFGIYWYMNCNHEKNERGEVVGWGSPFGDNKVQGPSKNIADFLTALGHDITAGTLTEDKKGLSEETIRDCIGRKCYVIEYETTDINGNGNNKRTILPYKFGTVESGIKPMLEWWKSLKNKPKKFNGNSSLGSIWESKKVEGEVDTTNLMPDLS
tara:strand:- start:2399 stop:3037 length:639 start_codon:yes stop_codon:yes gene_type:complete